MTVSYNLHRYFMKNILVFERTVYIRPLDRRLFNYCLLRQPCLAGYIFLRFIAAFLRLIGVYKAEKCRSLRWKYLSRVKNADKKLEAFWRAESRKAYRLFPEDSNVWLTLYPERAVRPLADMLGAELISGDSYQAMYEKAAAEGKPLLVADMYPPKVKTGADMVIIRRGRVMKSPAEYCLRAAVKGIYTFLALLLSGVGLGLLSMYFGAAQYLLEMFKTYFLNPWTPVLNIIPVVLLVFLMYFLFNRAWLAFFTSAAFTMVISLINYFKLSLRNDPLLFSDVRYALEGGAMAAEHYTLDINYKILLAAVFV
jgi:hypothetical protein